MVAHLDRPHLQNLAGVMESGKSWTKHRADFARSRLAFKMDRVAARRDRRVHAVLSPALPQTNRRRTDNANYSKAENKNCQREGCRRNHKLGFTATVPSPLSCPCEGEADAKRQVRVEC